MNIREKIYPLTGIRFFAAVIAVISNMCLWSDVDPGFARQINWGLMTGIITTPFRVDIFFLLSGFLLIYLYEEDFQNGCSFKKVINFYFLRLTKIYPLHLFTLFLILFLNFIGIWRPGSLLDWGAFSGDRLYINGSALTNFTLTSAWGLHDQKTTWNGPAWSLSAEWLNYLIFPLIPLLFLRIKSLRSYTLLILLLIINFFIFFQYELLNLALDNGIGGMMRSLTGFIIGGALAKIYLIQKWKYYNWDWIFLITLTLFSISLVYSHEVKRLPFTILFIGIPIMVFSLACSSSFIKNFFSKRIFLYLGKLSFSIYMLHQPVLRVMGYFLKDYYQLVRTSDHQVLMILNLFMCLTVIILCSAFTYHLIEKPSLFYLRKFLKLSFKSKS